MALKPHSSSSTLDRSTSEQIAQGLAQTLADTYITYVKTQNFHWNAIDRRFHSMHEMFEEFYKQLAEATDEIAERIRMLKLKSPGSMRQFLQLTTLEESDGSLSGEDMIRDLCHDRELIIKSIRPKIEEAQKLNDEGSADLYIQHLRMHEKAAWMLRSHLDEGI
jgi:starvation-inducible DNA-binding protein